MSSYNSIGGYFSLELGNQSLPHEKLLKLNTARNCFEYVLRANKTNHVYLPKFICDAMTEPLDKLGVKYTFYKINENFEIEDKINLKDDEFLVYVNYFGIKDNYCQHLFKIYKEQLILDCSQAFYFEPLPGGHVLYSPRKFFGVPDGGLLYTNNFLEDNYPTDMSYDRMTHLLKRIDLGAEKAYEDFKANEEKLNNQPIKSMSELTKRILQGIDFETAKKKRRLNFRFLHEKLKNSNKLSINIDDLSGPMVYPYYTKDRTLKRKLIENKIFIATYWPNVLEWCDKKETEYLLTKNILPLPIDQRYGEVDMNRILNNLEVDGLGK